MQLGQMIANIRKEHHLTQEEFADKFHVTRQTVSNWEHEKSYPDLVTLVKISETFHVSLDKMLKENQDMVVKMNKRMTAGKYAPVMGGAALVICLYLWIDSMIFHKGMLASALWLFCILMWISFLGEIRKDRKAGKSGVYEFTITEEEVQEIRSMKEQGKREDAVRRIREISGMGLAESMDYYDSL